MNKKRPREVWLEGFYPPVMEDFARWQGEWSMGPHAEPDWVWFKGDYYTEAQAREVLREKPDGVAGRE
jgi:hypothetical protein